MTHPSRRHRSRSRLLAVTLALPLLLGACSAGAEPTTERPAGDDDAATTGQDAAGGATTGWPRTVEVHEASVEIAAAPQRVVALSTETGDLALELVGHDRVAAVATGSVTEGAGNQLDEAGQVETVLPPGTTPDPEQILALEPDLVLITSRHEGEESAADILAESGVPALVFTSADFGTPDAVAASLRTLGTALGAEGQAETAAEALEAQVAEVTRAVAGATEQPRVLTLMARGDQVMITGLGSTLTTLTQLAGGDAVAEEQGWNGTVPADPELLVAAAPDVILVEDFRGTGMAPFTDLLAAQALSGVPAIAADQVHLVPSSEVSGSAGLHLADGLRTVAALLHPDLF